MGDEEEDNKTTTKNRDNKDNEENEDKKKKTKIEFNIVTSEDFCILAMVSLK